NMNKRIIITGVLLLMVGMVIFGFKEKPLGKMGLLEGMVIILQLPKRRHSKSRRDKRRANWKLKTVNLSRCPQCGVPKLPHRVCLGCGYYEGREIIPPKKKKDSSIMGAARLVKEKKAQAIVSAGNTGAAMVATKVVLGTLEGIERPAIAILMPHIHGVSILTDVGANVDCKPQHLLQFAIMGNTYAKEILEIEKPKVGLLSVGKERVKGNELTRTTYDLLEKTSLNFIGNVEGRDIFNGSVDVIVCDGFIGNVVLKTAESLAETIQGMLKKEITKNFLRKLGALLSMGAYRAVKKRIDYSEYGGAPLLGINGVCIITHGGAPALAIKNTLRVAGEFIDHKVNAHIIESIKGEKI
ncbi:phosphate acyltransferase PlsX, partial [bacterium]|nr:phosphate acyltransferase PlsX [bacterium]